MKRIVYILLLAVGMATVVPVLSLRESNVAVMCAADAKAKEKAQREKEKAKKLKEREKAKAQAQKEKEKAAKDKAKAKAQADKAKAKAQADKEKAKAQAAKAKSKQASSATAKSAKSGKPKAAPELSAAEEKAQYLALVQSIEKKNQKIIAYLNRDISHRLGFWGQVGYSNLFTSGVQYDKGKGLGFIASDKGFVGGGLGLGYQLRYKQFLMTVGAEFNTYNSVMGIANNEAGQMVKSYGMNPYPNTMTYTYTFNNLQETMIGGFAQIPLLFGMELRAVPLFWQAGVKVGMGVMSSSKLSGTFTTTIEDKELINDMTNMYSHALVTDKAVDRPANKINFGLNMAASAEIGVNLDQWLKSKAKMRVSVFADYGVLNALKYAPAAGAQDVPTQMTVAPNPLDFPVNAAYATTAASQAKVNPFLVGAKIAVWFELPRKQLEAQPMPEKPQPRLGVYAYDEETGLALGGVAIEVADSTAKAKKKNTNKQGQLKVGRVAEGQYRLAATKNGYFASDTIFHNVEEFTYDTIRVPLRRIPAPIVYTLCMNIYDVETQEPLEALVRFSSLADTATLYSAQSADDGFIETPLKEGNYIAHMSAVGYMPKDDTIHFVQDTLDAYLQAIKKGIKVKIENLFFATNKTYILPQSEQAMADLAAFLIENEGVTIHIVGHTDAIGSDEANQILSEGRANAVRASLVERGVAPERITTEGKGEKEPVADNDTEEGRQLNRRVEFTITGTDGANIEQIF